MKVSVNSPYRDNAIVNISSPERQLLRPSYSGTTRHCIWRNGNVQQGEYHRLARALLRGLRSEVIRPSPQSQKSVATGAELVHVGARRLFGWLHPLKRLSSCSGDQMRNERQVECLYVGQISHRKGIAVLLQAANKLQNLPIKFRLIGPMVSPEVFADLTENVWFTNGQAILVEWPI